VGDRRRAATGELEVADARLPLIGGTGREVLVRVPEGAVVHRVDGHGGVIAPAAVSGLRAAAGLEGPLLHGQLPGCVTCQPRRVAYRGIGRAAGHAVAHGDVAGAVHGDTCHPAVVGVGG